MIRGSPLDRNGRPNLVRLLAYYGLLGLVILAAFWPFADVLGYYFTKTDTGPLVFSARVEAPADLGRILTRSVMGSLSPHSIYFRPSTTLSFSLDYALWGLNPFGYHLTDLLLHAAVAGLLFRVVYLLNGRDTASAGLAGVLYGLHPVLVEVVPAVAHRQETLAAGFLLAGLWAFWRREYGGGGRLSLAAALACFVLSVGAKEIGILFLPLVLVHLGITNPDERPFLVPRLTSVLRRGLPYLAAAGLYVAWWGRVTRWRAFLGGGESFRAPLVRNSWWDFVERHLTTVPGQILPTYVRALLYPLLDVLPSPVTGGLPGWAAPAGGVLAVLLLGGLLILGRKGWNDRPVPEGPRGVEDAPWGSSLLFYLAWFCLPALFYTAVNVISYKHAYHGLLPFSAGLATLFVAAARNTGRRLLSPGAGGRPAGAVPGVILVVGLAGFMLLLGRVSPLRVEYPAWDYSQQVNRTYHGLLRQQLSRLPPRSTVGLQGSPVRIDPLKDFPHIAQSLRPDHWIPIWYPDRNFRIRRLSLKAVGEACPCPLWLERRRLGPRTFVFVTRLEQHDRPVPPEKS